MDIVQIIKDGGFIMLPLLGLSLIAWAVFFERLYFLYQFKNQFDLLAKKARDLIGEKKLHEAKGLCHNVHPLIGVPFLVVFEEPELSAEKWNGRMGRRLKETQAGLKRYLWLLGTIASSAPFIGLFGTVVGIIKSFESIASTGKSGFAVVSAGLGEALIATAAGIIVAVIAVIFYNYFQNRLGRLYLSIKNELEDIRELV